LIAFGLVHGENTLQNVSHANYGNYTTKKLEFEAAMSDNKKRYDINTENYLNVRQ